MVERGTGGVRGGGGGGGSLSIEGQIMQNIEVVGVEKFGIVNLFGLLLLLLLGCRRRTVVVVERASGAAEDGGGRSEGC